VKNYLTDEEEALKAVSTEEQRAEVMTIANDAEVRLLIGLFPVAALCCCGVVWCDGVMLCGVSRKSSAPR
jgi:hypothetical protein